MQVTTSTKISLACIHRVIAAAIVGRRFDAVLVVGWGQQKSVSFQVSCGKVDYSFTYFTMGKYVQVSW